MSEDKHFENDPERTLITLEQLSQTIEVMTSVVNRLRQHLSDQLHAQMEEQQEQNKSQKEPDASAPSNSVTAAKSAADVSEKIATASAEQKKEKFVVEIRQQNSDPNRKNGKTLH